MGRKLSELEQSILKVFSEERLLNEEELAVRVNSTPVKCRRALQKLIKKGLLTQEWVTTVDMRALGFHKRGYCHIACQNALVANRIANEITNWPIVRRLMLTGDRDLRCELLARRDEELVVFEGKAAGMEGVVNTFLDVVSVVIKDSHKISL